MDPSQRGVAKTESGILAITASRVKPASEGDCQARQWLKVEKNEKNTRLLRAVPSPSLIVQGVFNIDPKRRADTIIPYSAVTRGSHKPVSGRFTAPERLRGYPAEEALFVIRIVNRALGSQCRPHDSAQERVVQPTGHYYSRLNSSSPRHRLLPPGPPVGSRRA